MKIKAKSIDELLCRDDVNKCLDDLNSQRADIDDVLIITRMRRGELLVFDSGLDPGDFVYLLELTKVNYLNQQIRNLGGD